MLTRPKLIVAFGVSAALVLLTFSVFSARVHAAPPATPSTPEGSQIRIARMWHGRVPEAKAAEYYDYLNREGIEKIEKIPHNLGADVMTRTHDGVTELIVISYWHSLDDIKAYAGADIEKVHNLPRDAEFLIEPETTVRHFTIRRSDRLAVR